jgi:MscS family membrane protein
MSELTSRVGGLLAQATTEVTTRPSVGEITLLDRLGLRSMWELTPLTAWLVLLGAIFAGVLAGKLISEVLRRGARRLEGRGAHQSATVLMSAATPTALLAVTVGLSIGLQPIFMDTGARDVVRRTLNLLYVLSVAWFLFNLVDLIDLWLKNLASKTASALDDQIAPLIRKTLRIFLVVLVGLYIAQNIFDQDITAWLAGLGIAGLAVSLAAQDSIRNLFGSITVLADKPFHVGDRIVFDGFDGSVEEIGFRSTRVRTLAGELATVPNSKFIDGSVLNITRRPNIRRMIDIGVEYGTPVPTIAAAVERLREIMAEPGVREHFDWEKAPPRVYFDEMKADNLNIKVMYWWNAPTDWWGLMDLNQKLLLRFMDELTKLGVAFAFPTQTMVLTNDGEKPLKVEVGGEPGRAMRQ